ncbi:putative ribonuclease H-like domain-containing protein [Tanacetum coccineum]
MDSDKYLEGKSMQRPPLFESDCFIYWKNRFETYVKAKDLDLWHIILNGDFPPVAKNEVTQILEEVPFELQDDNLKKKLAKNNEAKMWVFRNKRDERSIVVKNKARLVAQGHRQEERIDYDEMDVESAFLYGTIEEDVHQPPGFVDPAHPNKVYKNGFRRGTIDKTLFIKKNKSDIMLVQVYVDDIIFGSTKKSMCTEFEEVMHKRFQMSSMGELTFFLGLQVKQQPDGIFISQDKYVADILKKFDFCSIKTATTPIESNKPLVKDEDGVEVDVHEYRSMIGSLMYLTASRPDIMFAVCACARFQVTPKASHLHAVKRIFRYLKHQPKLGLWYPRDSPFELEAFSDSDYAGASLDRKSTTGGCQFLGRRLISWQCKKQTIVANSTTEAKYVTAAHCCGQNPVYHSRTKHIKIRHHFIRDCYEKRLKDVLKIYTDSNVADLLTKGFDVTRRSMDLRMDRCSVRQIYSYLVNSDSLYVNTGSLYVNSVHMANLKYSDKHYMVAFLKKPNESVGFTEVVDFLKVRTLANGTQQLVASIDSKEYTITEASVRSKLQLADATGIHNLFDAKIYAGLATLGYVTEDITTEEKGRYLASTLTKKLFANMKRGYAGDIIPLLPAMLAGAAVDQVLVPTLVTKITSLENELKETKQTLGNVVLKLVKKVKSLEQALKRKSKKVLISESKGEELKDQGRKIQDIDDDPLVSLVRESMKEKSTNFVTRTKALGEAQEEEISPTILETAKTLSKVASQGVSKEKSTDKGKRYRRRARSMARKIDTRLDAEEEVNTGREKINTCIEEISTRSTKIDSDTASKRSQREGKAPMVEEDIKASHKTKEKMRQEQVGLEEAIKLQA